jgi:predicted amidohydrolase
MQTQAVEDVDAAVTPSDSTPKTVDVKKDRISAFTSLSKADLDKFSELIGKENVITDVDEINPFVRDFTNKYVGIGSVVLTPTTTE